MRHVVDETVLSDEALRIVWDALSYTYTAPPKLLYVASAVPELTNDDRALTGNIFDFVDVNILIDGGGEEGKSCSWLPIKLLMGKKCVFLTGSPYLRSGPTGSLGAVSVDAQNASSLIQ
jgi:hypothetical protein